MRCCFALLSCSDIRVYFVVRLLLICVSFIRIMEPDNKEAPERHCKYYVKRKNRYCKFEVAEGAEYCRIHDESNTDRVPCPYERDTFVVAGQL